MRGIVTAALVAVLLVATVGTVCAQSPYEMRAYVGPTGGPTEMFNMAGIRATYVCPYCRHSSYQPGNCSNPYDDDDHPSDLAMVQVTAAHRVLSTSQHEIDAGDPRDYEYSDTLGNTVGRIVMGKVLHPEDNGDVTRSTLHLQSCNLADADGNSGAGNKIAGTTHLRFFLMPPGVTRPCAVVTGMTETLGDGNGGIIIGLNPYRLDDGDEWYIEYRTWNAGGPNFRAEVKMYSQLYGQDFDGWNTINQPTTTYISNSGAVTVQATHAGFTLDQQYRYRFTVSSNARLFPSYDEMPALVEAGLGAVLPRGCWLEPTGGVITTDSNVVETGNPAVARDALDIQPNEVGIGTAAVQYADLNPGGPPLGQGANGNLTYRCYNGGEWQYDWELVVDNVSVGEGTANFGARQYVEYLGETRYVSSRVVIPATGNLWAHSDDYGDTEAAELNAPNITYPRIILGSVLDPTVPNPIVVGEYGPGMRTPTRQFDLYNRFQDDSVLPVLFPRRCSFCGRIETDPAEDECLYHATPIALPTEEMVGDYHAGHEIWSDLVVSGTVDRVDNTGAVTSYAMRHVLPKSACKFGYEMSGSLFDNHEYDRNIYQVYAHEDDASSSNAQSVYVQIPSHQPPSVPPVVGATFSNWLDEDEGYRGGLVMWADEEYLHVTPPAGSGAALTDGWDVFYRCPDCGGLTDDADDHPGGACSGHRFCTLCAAEYPNGVATCPFCDQATTAINGDDAIQEHDLWCEEYDVAGLQVSVLRKPSMRATAPAVQLGRVQPGVGSSRPDVNVQNISGNRAFPADTSLEATMPMVNNGNITSAVRLGNVTNRDAASADVALPHYSRLQVPAYDYSSGRIAQATPITRLTMKSYSPYGNAPAASWDFPSWNIAGGVPFAAGGVEQLGSLQAGYPAAGGVYDEQPIPLGQPAGTYLGQTLCFLDTNGDGALSFEIGGPGGVGTNTFNAQFDPLVDHPLEPVYDTVTGDVRVFGSRLPHNDYYSADASPTAIISGGNPPAVPRVQVIWTGSRPSAAGTASLPVACAPGDDISDIPSSSAPVNLLYATAEYKGSSWADDELYRSYSWPVSGSQVVDPYNLSNDSGSGTVSSSPWARLDSGGAARWAFWHRRLQHPGGTESTLRYDTSTAGDWAWSGSGAGEWIYSTGLPKENLRSFVQPEDGDHWLFWHTGSAGQQQLMYRWDYTLGTTDDNEGPVPVANRAGREWRADTFPAINAIPHLGSLLEVNIKKPSQSPFVYTKDPSVFLDPGGDVNLFFSGYVRSEQEADVCWVRFDMIDEMTNDRNPEATNYGKVAFQKTSASTGPYVYTTGANWVRMPEEFRADGVRQAFVSRHTDWICSDDTSVFAEDLAPPTPPGPNKWNFAKDPHAPLHEKGATGASSPQAPNLDPGTARDPGDASDRLHGYVWDTAYLDPVFCLALIYDNLNDGGRPQAQVFYITWEEEDHNQYLRSRGIYRVRPKLYQLTAGPVPEPPFIAHGSGYLLQDPKVTQLRAKGMTVPNQYVTMEVNPATGTLTFSSPLFNVDNPNPWDDTNPFYDPERPGDPSAVFNNGISLGGEFRLRNVALFGAYYAYVHRVTRNGADDDCPSAFYIPSVDSSRLTVFWRRRYPVSSAPHFGRSGFMHKSYATSVQVAKPPIDSDDRISTLEDAYSHAPMTHISKEWELTAGIVKFGDADVGTTVHIVYDTPDGVTHSEFHQVPGWSAERPVPIRTGGAEGRLAVQPEVYSVSGMNTVRYWLFWTSLGRVFDLRLLNASVPGSTPNAGARVGGEPIILQSSDVYSAVVSPETGPVVRERQTATVSFDPT